MYLVVMAGLPGSGKTSIALALAARLDLCMVQLDHLEAVLARNGVDLDSLQWGGYELLTVLAEDNLSLGRGVLLDSVTWTRWLRRDWAALAARYGAMYRPIEVTCSVPKLHRERVEHRQRHLKGLPELSWQRVEQARRLYEAWDTPRLVLDSVRPLEELVRAATAYVLEPWPPANIGLA